MTEIHGSWFIERAGPTLVRHLVLLSPDGRFLATVSSSTDQLFRVHVFERATDPQWIGTHWADVGSPSVTDTLEAAERLAHERLQTNAA